VYELPDLDFTPTDNNDSDKPGLACRMEVIEGMTISSISQSIKLDGITEIRGVRERVKGN